MFAFLLNPGYNICLGLIEQNLCRDISKDEKIKLKSKRINYKFYVPTVKHEESVLSFCICYVGSVNTNDILATLLLFCF